MSPVDLKPTSESSDPTGVSPALTTPPRRRWLVGGLGTAAALAGLGMAWRQQGDGSSSASATGSSPSVTGVQALWSLQLEGPGGEPMAMRQFQGKPLLLNFWATWCPPCVEELPLLNQFYREHAAKSWQVVGLAIDQPSSVRKFLQKMPLAFPVVMGGLDGTEIGRSMGNLGGSLPFTVVVDARGQVVHRKMGALRSDELQTMAKAYGV